MAEFLAPESIDALYVSPQLPAQHTAAPLAKTLGVTLAIVEVTEVQLHAWKFAGPCTPHPDRCVVARTEPGSLVVAGDAFGGPKVEGAFNSGLAAAQTLGA